MAAKFHPSFVFMSLSHFDPWNYLEWYYIEVLHIKALIYAVDGILKN